MTWNRESERMRRRSAEKSIDERTSDAEPTADDQAKGPSEALPVPEDREHAREQIRAAIERRRKALDALAEL